MFPRNYILNLIFPAGLFCSFSSSKASTSSSTQANQTSTYNTTDQRQGVDGQGNLVAGAGATIAVTDVSDKIAKAAFDAAQGVTDSALVANVKAVTAGANVASDAISGMVQSQAKSLDSVNYAVGQSADVAGQAITAATRATDTVAKTFSDLSANQVSLLSQLIQSNADTTNAGRKSDSDLATSFLEKSVTAIADNKTSADQTIVTTGIKYAAYAAIAVAVALGLYAVSKRKS